MGDHLILILLYVVIFISSRQVRYTLDYVAISYHARQAAVKHNAAKA